jgi:hypothetical protein
MSPIEISGLPLVRDISADNATRSKWPEQEPATPSSLPLENWILVIFCRFAKRSCRPEKAYKCLFMLK